MSSQVLQRSVEIYRGRVTCQNPDTDGDYESISEMRGPESDVIGQREKE